LQLNNSELVNYLIFEKQRTNIAKGGYI